MQTSITRTGFFSLSPISRRRLENFKANRRGYYSLWIFLLLLVLTVPAEFIANDKPLLVYSDGEYYTPIVNFYTELDFGGEFDIEPDYKSDYMNELISDNDGWSIFPPIAYNFRTVNRDVESPSAPSTENLLGTDDHGRDVLARVIYGYRISIFFGLILTLVSSVIGIVIGAMQGYYGGWLDLLGQRFIEVWTSVPTLYLIIIIASVISPNFWILLLILLLFSWVALVGVVRAEFLRARNFEYVSAAKALGVSDMSIMMRHMLPNAMVATLTFLPFILNGSITTLTSLDYLGFGLPPGSPSLGELLLQGRNNLQAPWLGISGFVTMAIMLSLLIFIGEGIRDAFDPRKTFIK